MTEARVPPALRRLVVERARNRCEYCRYPGLYSPQSLSIDHIVPRGAGGAKLVETRSSPVNYFFGSLEVESKGLEVASYYMKRDLSRFFGAGR